MSSVSVGWSVCFFSLWVWGREFVSWRLGLAVRLMHSMSSGEPAYSHIDELKAHHTSPRLSTAGWAPITRNQALSWISVESSPGQCPFVVGLPACALGRSDIVPADQRVASHIALHLSNTVSSSGRQRCLLSCPSSHSRGTLRKCGRSRSHALTLSRSWTGLDRAQRNLRNCTHC